MSTALLLLSAIAATTVLWSSRVPGFEGSALFVSFGLFAVSALLVVLRWKTFSDRRGTLAVAVVMLFGSSLLALSGVMPHAAFRVSRQGLESRVAAVQQGRLSAVNKRNSWVGIYRVERTWVEGDIIYFRFADAGVIMSWGVAYVPDGLPPGHRRAYRHIDGPWFYYNEYAG
jgi:hypothetical protein